MLFDGLYAATGCHDTRFKARLAGAGARGEKFTGVNLENEGNFKQATPALETQVLEPGRYLRRLSLVHTYICSLIRTTLPLQVASAAL